MHRRASAGSSPRRLPRAASPTRPRPVGSPTERPEASMKGRGLSPKKPWNSAQICRLTRETQVLVSRAVVTKTQAQAPVRSLEQRMDALRRANDIRARRAKLKKDLKDRRAPIEEILHDPPEYMSTEKVIDMLNALPKIGRAT